MKKKEIRRLCTGLTKEELKKEIRAMEKEARKLPRSATFARGAREINPSS